VVYRGETSSQIEPAKGTSAVLPDLANCGIEKVLNHLTDSNLVLRTLATNELVP
jgi:hypothetical protein